MADIITTGSTLEIINNSGDGTDIGSLSRISNTVALSLYFDFSWSRVDVLALSVSGTTVSKGTSLPLDFDYQISSDFSCQVVGNNATEGCAIYHLDTGPSNEVRARVLSLSGLTITRETVLTLTTSVALGSVGLGLLAEDKYLAIESTSNNTTDVYVLTQSAVTLTQQTPLNLSSAHELVDLVVLSSTRALSVSFTGGTATVNLLNISSNTVTSVDSDTFSGAFQSDVPKDNFIKLTTTTASLLYKNASNEMQAVILSDNTSTVGIGTALATGGTTPAHIAASYNTGRFLITGQGDATSFNVSGTTISSQANSTAMPVSDNINSVRLTGTTWLATGAETTDEDLFAFVINSTTTEFEFTTSSGEGKSLATSSDGGNIFVALNNADGFPVMVQTTRDDPETFTKSYNPGAGSASNVTASPSNPDIMLFYGNFGTDLTVATYTISTDTVADISPASLSSKVVNTLAINPDGVSEAIITVDTDQDLKRTNDGGVTWTDWDAALGFDATALWPLWSGLYFPHRYFVGGEVGGGDLDLLYSNNEGASSENFEGTALGILGGITAIEATEEGSI